MKYCLLVFSSLGDLFKFIREIIYLANVDKENVYVSFHLFIYFSIVVCRAIYDRLEIQDQQDVEVYQYQAQTRLIRIFIGLWLFEISWIILLGFVALQLFNGLFVLGMMYSFLINIMYLRHWKWIANRDLVVAPMPLTMVSTQYIAVSHQCLADDCYYCPCFICTEKVDYLIELSCKHSIHHSCFVNWRQRRNTCPLCRALV